MTESQLWDTFSGAVTTFAAALSPPLPVIHGGVHGTPPDAARWLETRFFPNKTENYGLSNDGPSMQRGFFQITVGERPGSGLVRGMAVAGQVITAFPKGTKFGTFRVPVKPWISSVLQSGDRVLYPVTIRYELITR